MMRRESDYHRSAYVMKNLKIIWIITLIQQQLSMILEPFIIQCVMKSH